MGPEEIRGLSEGLKHLQTVKILKLSLQENYL